MLPEIDRRVSREKGGDQVAQPFSSLPPEKQEQITRAGLEVFSKNEYKKASTDDIAAKSGISKGLLFYYFKNKCSLYLYLADYVREAITRQLSPESLAPVTDFFEMLEVAVERKRKILEKFPWALEFCMRMYFCTDRELLPHVRKYISVMTEKIYEEYFSRLDTSRFVPGMTPRKAMELLLYLTDGYCHKQLIDGEKLDMDALLAEFRNWCVMLRKYVYRPEYWQPEQKEECMDETGH